MKRQITELIVEVELHGEVKTFPMEKFDFVIGRSKDADVQVDIKEASRRHLRVSEKDGHIFVTDLGSKNGTKVSGEPLHSGEESLYPIGAELTLGKGKQVIRIRARVEAAKPHLEGSFTSQPEDTQKIQVPELSELSRTDILVEPDSDKTAVLSDEDLSESLQSSLVTRDLEDAIELEGIESQDDRASLTTVDIGSLDGAIKKEKERNERETKQEREVEAERIRLSREEEVESIEPSDSFADSLADSPDERSRSESIFARLEDEISQELEQDKRFTDPKVPTQREPTERPKDVPPIPVAKAAHIPKNPQAQNRPHPRDEKKYGFSKLADVKGLVSEITSDATKAIDENFFNVPPEKRAAKKAEKILGETRRAAEELQEQAYAKHDRIIKKATCKAKELLNEAESDKANFLADAKESIEKLRANQLEANEAVLDKVIDEANAKAKELIEDAERISSELKAEAQKRIDLSHDQANTIVANAQAKSESILNGITLKKEQVELEVADLEGRQDELQKLILRLGDQVEEWENKIKEAKSAAQEALELNQLEQNELEERKMQITAERALVEKQFIDLSIEHDKKREEIQNQHREILADLENALAEKRMKIESDEARLSQDFSKKEAELQLQLEMSGKNLDEQMRLRTEQLEADFVEKHDQVEDEFQEHKERLDKQTRAIQSEFNQLKAEIEGEKEALKDRVESLTQNKKELFAIVQGLEAQKTELAELIAANEQAWLDGASHYEKALKGREEAELDKVEIQKQRDLALAEIERLRDHKNNIQEAIDNLDNTKAQELKNISIMKEEALKQIGVERSRFEAELAIKRQESEKQLDELARQTLLESNKVVEQAERVKAEAAKTAEEMIGEASLKSQDLNAQAESWKQNQLADLKAEKEAWLQEFEAEKAKSLSAKQDWEQNFERMRTSQKREHQEEMQKLKTAYEEKLTKLQSEQDDLTQKQRSRLELEMADARVKRMAAVESEVQHYKDLYEKQKEERAKVLVRSLDSKLITQLKPILGDHSSGKVIDDISGELQKVVMETLIPDGDFKDEEFREFIGVHAKEMVGSSRFWKKSVAVAAVLFLLVGLPSMWRAFKTQTTEMASQKKSKNAARYIESVQEKRKSKPKFDPEMKDEYLESYTDRVLMTKDYADNELEPAYRELWILSLNEFFVEKLGLSENVIVPFIAMESNLIRELSDLRKKVHPERFEQSTEPMRKAEKEFTEQIQKTLKKKSNYKKFLKFKQKYYSDKYLPKQEA